MHLKSTRDLCQDVGEGKKRYDFQTIFSPFSTGNIYRGIKAKCLGCKICYMHHIPGGIGRDPQPFDKIFPNIRREVRKGKVELITDLIDAFLNPVVGELILKIHDELPEARFNLITKLPSIALQTFKQYPELTDVPHHIQVTTMMDGIPIPGIVEEVKALIPQVSSLSCRVDPYVPGISSIGVFEAQIADLAKVGVKRITTNTLKLYRGQWKYLPGLNQEVYSDGDKAGSAKIMNEVNEWGYFGRIQAACVRAGVDLGVCMSRLQVRHFESAPCEGIGLNEYKGGGWE